MDYLRQQIEASLGRSEELIMSDKARRRFYRYPSEPLPLPPPPPPPPQQPPKKSSKERGTFNSVRLKKYLGLGSKRKQKIDKDEVHQTLQQKAYLEELQRYGPVAALPPYYECHTAVPIFHPSSCYREPWSCGGTVRIHGNPAAYPNMVCASVSARSVRQRRSLQNAMYGWEPFFQSPPNMITMPESMRYKETLQIMDGCCNCEEQFLKSMKHCTKCTCSSGNKSQKVSKSKNRTSLFNSDVIRYPNGTGTCSSGGGSGGIDRHSMTHESAQKMDRLTRHEMNVSKSKLRHLSDAASRAADLEQSNSRHGYRDVFFKRKSILECPVNPYDLMVSRSGEPKRRSAPAKVYHDPDNLDDSFSDILELEAPPKSDQSSAAQRPPASGAFRDLTERHSPSTKSNQQEITSSKRSDTDNDKVADISLGGQRIRLFGSVKGTVSKHEKSSKRTPLMKETNLTVPLTQSTPRPSLSRPPQRPAPPPPPPLPPPRKTSTSSTTDFQNGTFLNRAAKQAMEEEGIEEMFVGSPKSAVSSQTQCDIQSMDQHKTRITIKCTSRPTHPSVPPPPPPPPPPPTPLPPLPQQQNQQQPLENHQEFPQNEQAASKDKLELQEASCQTVIAVGQEPQDTTTNRLNLKINLSELSAYLKPILKKAAVNESSTSSEAEGSETYSSTSVDVRQKKKKHVHFLSNRLSINSDDASQESSTDNPSSSPLLPDIVSKEHSNITTSSSNTEQDIETKEEDGGQAVESLVGTAGQKMDALEALYDDASSANHNSSNSNTDLQNVDSDGDVQGFATRLALTSDSDADNNRTAISLGSSNMSVGDQPVDCELLPSRRRNRSLASRDSRKASLRRSQSERAVVIAEDQERCDSKPSRVIPFRSNSFQALVPQYLRPHRDYSPDDENRNDNKLLTFCSPNNLNSTPHGIKKYIFKDINHQQQGVCQNDFKANNNNNNSNNSAVTTVLNSIASTRQKLLSGDTRMLNSHPNAINHSKNSNEEDDGDDDDDVTINTRNHLNISTDDSSSSSSSFSDSKMQDKDCRWNNDDKLQAPLDIAKLRAIPKFLPRPIFDGKHKVHVCHKHKIEAQPLPEIILDQRQSPESPTGWSSSSEDDLYTDGSSVLSHNNQHIGSSDFNKPLPPIPTEGRRDSSSSSPDYSSNENIYERIPEHVYEEVPELVSYTPTISTSGTLGQPRKSIFEGASRIEILNYLEDAKERGVENIEPGTTEESGLLLLAEEDEEESQEEPDPSQNLGTKRHHRNRISNVSNLSDSSNTSEDSFQNDEGKDDKDRPSHQSAEVERNDSGVGSETSKPSRLRRQSRLGSNEQICVDCDQPLDSIWDHDGGNLFNPLVCQKCSKKRNERKEIILEFVETEIKYGRDLKIIKEEFHRPMLVAGLLTEDLLNNIFLNLDQLVEVNEKFSEKLRDALDIAVEQGDEDFNTVNVGKVFLESSIMLHAFEAYCVRQGTASLLLTNLEKDRELLRIFLKVSQMENTLLRRLNLNSFLMVPVQRVTKYPLLLNRLYKVTPHQHQDREALREAQLKIELHLEHINQQAKDFSGMNIWRRISNISNSQRRNLLEPVIGNIKLRKTALEILQWNNEEVRFVMEGRLQYTQLTDHLLNKREKSLKLTPVHGLLITLGNPNSNYRPDLADRDFIFPRNTGIREATLVLIKEKSNRFHLVREPLQLQRCVISSEPDVEDVFEIQEFTMKESYLLKGDDAKDTQEWLKMLRYHAKDLGAWRRRRNALANIMINGMAARREWL